MLVAFTLLSVSCKKSEPPTQPPETTAPAPQRGPDLGEDEARKFGQRFEQAFRNRDEGAMSDCLRTRALYERILREFGSTDPKAELDPIFRTRNPDAMYLNEFGKLSCRFLKVRQVEGRYRALFRFVGDDNHFNYREFVLGRSPDGSVVSEDVFLYDTAELLSDSLRRVLGAAEGKRGAAPELTDQTAALTALMSAATKGDSAAVIRKYGQLSKHLQQNKSVLFIYIKALSKDDARRDTVVKLIEQFRILFPNDACLDMLSVGYHLQKQEFGQALAATDRLDQAIGGDPFLRVIRAECHVGMREFSKARAQIDAAVMEEPGLTNAYWTGILLSLLEKKHDDTLAWLKRMVESCGAQVPDLSRDQDFEGFVKSPQYEAWVDWYARRKN